MAKTKAKCVKAYVVHKRQWFFNDEYHMPFDPGTPVKTFLSRHKAEAYRLELEQTARKEGELTNPFWLQGLEWDDWCSLSEAEFDRRVVALGVEPIGGDSPFEWWDDIAEDLTDEQRDGIWGLLDQVRLFEVAEAEVELEE